MKGHGTQMGGLALFGDLTPKLHQGNPVSVVNRLESVKLLPDAGMNPHHLLGAVTRQAINAVEQVGPRRRTFTMTTTTGEDTRMTALRRLVDGGRSARCRCFR